MNGAMLLERELHRQADPHAGPDAPTLDLHRIRPDGDGADGGDTPHVRAPHVGAPHAGRLPEGMTVMDLLAASMPTIDLLAMGPLSWMMLTAAGPWPAWTVWLPMIPVLTAIIWETTRPEWTPRATVRRVLARRGIRLLRVTRPDGRPAGRRLYADTEYRIEYLPCRSGRIGRSRLLLQAHRPTLILPDGDGADGRIIVGDAYARP